jgi:acyl-[acyl-carrier-protein]-phospholipid O-acyltransferase/long-chain-fatty-acid--[acyl-carrier-protein] ligase
VGATFLSQFPNFSKVVLGADETVVTLFMAMFSIGIGLGSLLCDRLLKGEVSAKYVATGGLLMTVFMLDLSFITWGAVPTPGIIVSYATFIDQVINWRILADLIAISIAAGIYTVPLYAILQRDSARAHRSRIVAANNILNALFMVVGSLFVTWMLTTEWRIPHVFLLLALLNIGVAGWMIRLQKLVKSRM